MPRAKLNQKLALLDIVNPASIAASTVTMTAINTGLHRKVLYLVVTGALGTSATVDFKLQASATSGGTYADISGKAITQLVKASNDNNQAIVEIDAAEMPAGKPWLKGVLTVGTAASIVNVVALGNSERYEPASAYSKATLVQTVA